MKITRIEFL